MSWKCPKCGKGNPSNLNLCECGHKWSIWDSTGEPSPPLPTWVKIAAAVVFPTCMIAGLFYFRQADPGSFCAGPFGLLVGAAAAIFIIGVLVVLKILTGSIIERQWTQVKPFIVGLAALGLASVAGYCLVGWNGIFLAWILVIGVSLIIFCVQELVRGKYDEETGGSAVRDVGLIIIALVIVIFAIGELRLVWKEQYEKTGKTWHVSVLMNEERLSGSTGKKE